MKHLNGKFKNMKLNFKKCPNCKGEGAGGWTHFQTFSKYDVQTWGEGRGGGQLAWDKFPSFAVFFFLEVIPYIMNYYY